MTRQESLDIIWKKLLITVVAILAVMAATMLLPGDSTTIVMMFIVGNLGGYAATHKNLSTYSDDEIDQLSKSWFGLILPPVIGGILSMVIYLLFVSHIISGELFPEIVNDTKKIPENFTAIFAQHAKDPSDYAKLLFWGFVAGFNEKYVTNVIDAIRKKSLA